MEQGNEWSVQFKNSENNKICLKVSCNLQFSVKYILSAIVFIALAVPYGLAIFQW